MPELNNHTIVSTHTHIISNKSKKIGISRNAHISVALATYNGEKYLKEQINSILSQSIQDFELIICDDCSTDTTLQILHDYENRDSRIKIYKNDYNLGFKKNFERAISLCSGDYIALCDQDDIWLPNHLKVLTETIRDGLFACADSQMFYMGKMEVPPKTLSKFDSLNFFYPGKLSLYRILCYKHPFAGHNIIMKTDFIKSLLPIPNIVNYHDVYFSTMAAIKNSLCYSFIPITKYRQHKDQITNHSIWLPGRAIKNGIKHLLKKKRIKTDRLDFIKYIESQSNIPDYITQMLTNCELFLKFRLHQTKGKQTLEAIKFFWNNYRYIYTQKTNRNRLIRLFEILAIRYSTR